MKKPAPSLGKIKGIVREESAYLHYEKTKKPVQSQKLHWLFGFRGKKMRPIIVTILGLNKNGIGNVMGCLRHKEEMCAVSTDYASMCQLAK